MMNRIRVLERVSEAGLAERLFDVLTINTASLLAALVVGSCSVFMVVGVISAFQHLKPPLLHDFTVASLLTYY